MAHRGQEDLQFLGLCGHRAGTEVGVASYWSAREYKSQILNKILIQKLANPATYQSTKRKKINNNYSLYIWRGLSFTAIMQKNI